MAASHSDPATQGVIALDIGLGFTPQDQRLRGIQRRTTDHFAVDQAVQEVQHMGLGRDALGQRQFHGGQHGLFIVVQNERKDVDHLAVASRLCEQVLLQLLAIAALFSSLRAQLGSSDPPIAAIARLTSLTRRTIYKVLARQQPEQS